MKVDDVLVTRHKVRDSHVTDGQTSESVTLPEFRDTLYILYCSLHKVTLVPRHEPRDSHVTDGRPRDNGLSVNRESVTLVTRQMSGDDSCQDEAHDNLLTIS